MAKALTPVDFYSLAERAVQDVDLKQVFSDPDAYERFMETTIQKILRLMITDAILKVKENEYLS